MRKEFFLLLLWEISNIHKSSGVYHLVYWLGFFGDTEPIIHLFCIADYIIYITDYI